MDYEIRSKRIKRQSRIGLLSILLVPMLWGWGIASHYSLADDDPTNTLTPQLSDTGTLEIQTPTVDALDTSVPTPNTPITEEVTETEIAISATPEPTQITEAVTFLNGEYSPDEVLVRIRPAKRESITANCFSGIVGSTVTSEIDEINVLVLKVPNGNVAQALAQIKNCAGVLYAEPNYLAHIADTIPNDPYFGNQYGLTAIRAPEGWDYSTGSANVTIAIIDTGIDLSHADFTGKIVPGYDFVNGDSIPQDDNGHGTHVAGIAAATGNNGIGIAGVSWGARIMPVKVLNSGGNGSFADVAAGITWAADHGAQVINLSLGGTSPSNVLQDAVNYAYGKGVVLVAAAGNTGTNFILYPAHYPNVIAVGAVDSTNNHAGFSNFGPELDLVAPGAAIYSTVIGGYGYKSGTSMAAPYVSGLAAILSGMNSSPAVITFEMESSALDLGAVGFDYSYGYGLIQVDKALKLVALPTTTPTSTSTASLEPTLATHSRLPTISSGSQGLFSAPNLRLSTATATQTKTLFVSRTSTVTSTLLPPTIQPTVSAISQGQISPTQQEKQALAQESNSWQLLWAGLAFLSAGLLLGWAVRRGWLGNYKSEV